MYEDKKMGETAVSNPSLQVSVSFGRFENDSLSWEKWSTFSPNKYLEEVERCATPGSVAQKKAYFEAHYKKIAARKAELQVQEKQTEKNSFRSEDQNSEDLSGNNDEDQGSVEGVEQETDCIGEMGRTHVDNSEEVIAENTELESRSDCSQVNKPEEAVFVKEEESTAIKPEDVKELSHDIEIEIVKDSEVEPKDVKLDHRKENKKVAQAHKESTAAKLKKKPLPSTSKASQISTPRNSRPTSSPPKTLASASSIKRGNSPSLPGRKSNSTGQNKRVANKSLHMSLSLGPSNPPSSPNPAPLTTLRKSLIMEKMGDKDIVKRAFKTFQNNFKQPKSFIEERSLLSKQVSSKGTEPMVPTSMALRKQNGRPSKVESIDKRSGNAARTTIGLKTDIRAGKTKESPNKMEEKSNAKEAGRARLQSKSKDEKEAEIKKLKHGFKATPLPAFYSGQKASKNHPEKHGDAKAEKPR
ncbi:hypothetical protein L6164_027187 [Bauhinia variegata]|uniref:Uncharacterized protein n=1 Tax=Bauhinia variegata TaxID=167791 RepID=A0ACB9LS69_BAUVA|nr:hypothetical protein L6164_027187 [Bauhinia variegata]